MKSGRSVSEQYLEVIDWLNSDAKPGGPEFVWQKFPDAGAAQMGAKRLAAALRAQVRLPEGQRYSIRRSKSEGESVDVVVYVYAEPTGLVRMPQGKRP